MTTLYTEAGRTFSLYDPADTLAFWAMQQSGQDWTGNHRDLATVGTVPYSLGTDGRYMAGPFSTSNYFKLDKTLLQGRSVWSMVIDFESDATTGASQYLYLFTDGTNQYQVYKNVTTGDLYWLYGNGTESVKIYTALPAGRHTLAMTYNGVNATFWLDGNLRAKVVDAKTIPASLTRAVIGIFSSPAANPWLGTIHSMRLYSRALTDYELATPIANNVAYYGMQQSGADWSGQKNHLTTVGNVPYALQSDGRYAAGPFSTANYFTCPVTGLTSYTLICTAKASGASWKGLYSGGSATCDWRLNGDNHKQSMYNGGANREGVLLYTDEEWTIFAVVVVKNSSLTFYKNGTLDKAHNLTTTDDLITHLIGGYWVLDGIKNFKIFSRALTPAEIAADYAASFPPALTGSEVASMTAGTADVEVFEGYAQTGNVKTFSMLGLDLSDYVTSWGTIEEIKEVLLAKSDLFTGQMSLVLDNSKGIFSPNAGSTSTTLFQGRSWFNTEGIVELDGATVFSGILKDVSLDHAEKTATLVFENTFSRPAETTVLFSATSINPVWAMMDLFDTAGLGQLIDRDSFIAAAGVSAQNGAVVNIAATESSNTTLLDMIQQLSELAGVSVFVRGGLIRAQAWTPYTGGGIMGTLQASTVREWSLRETAYEAIFNQAAVNYGASSVYTASDQTSINTYTGKVAKPKAFQTKVDVSNIIQVPDLASAMWFASNYVARASMLRDEITCTVGSDQWPTVSIGDRYAVTAPHWGLTAKAFEVIETHRDLSSTSIELKLASIETL